MAVISDHYTPHPATHATYHRYTTPYHKPHHTQPHHFIRWLPHPVTNVTHPTELRHVKHHSQLHHTPHHTIPCIISSHKSYPTTPHKASLHPSVPTQYIVIFSHSIPHIIIIQHYKYFHHHVLNNHKPHLTSILTTPHTTCRYNTSHITPRTLYHTNHTLPHHTIGYITHTLTNSLFSQPATPRDRSHPP